MSGKFAEVSNKVPEAFACGTLGFFVPFTELIESAHGKERQGLQHLAQAKQDAGQALYVGMLLASRKAYILQPAAPLSL